MAHIQILSNCEMRSVIRFFTENEQNAILIHCYDDCCTSLQMVRWWRTKFSNGRNHGLGDKSVPQITTLFQLFAKSSIMTDDWRLTILSFFYPRKLKLLILKFSECTWKVVSGVCQRRKGEECIEHDWLKENVAEWRDKTIIFMVSKIYWS